MRSISNSYADGGRELTEAVGRLLIVGFEGRDFPEIEALLTRVRPAGLIFFKRNYPDGPAAEAPHKLRELIEQAQALAESLTGRRLLVAIDHEGGRVQRLPAPFTALPAPGSLKPGEVEVLAETGARELAAVGFNFNMAPVLDVASPLGGYMGDRSFSDDPDRVAEYGRSCLAAFHRVGLLGLGKHFPGLGSAAIDPHHELPTINIDRQRLAEVDLMPYRELIGGGELAAVMSTHALYPALDKERPATFSEEIVNLLKDDLAFSGALLTDDLEMGAVVKNYPPGEAAVEAVRAGHDLALICRRADYVEECRGALAAAVGRGQISEKRLTDALSRSDQLIRRLMAFWPDDFSRTQWFGELSARPADPPKASD